MKLTFPIILLDPKRAIATAYLNRVLPATWCSATGDVGGAPRSPFPLGVPVFLEYLDSSFRTPDSRLFILYREEDR